MVCGRVFVLYYATTMSCQQCEAIHDVEWSTVVVVRSMYSAWGGVLSALIVQWLDHLVVAEKTWVRFPLGAGSHLHLRSDSLRSRLCFDFSCVFRVFNHDFCMMLTCF